MNKFKCLHKHPHAMRDAPRDGLRRRHGGGGERPEFGMRGGRRRMFEGGELRLVLLALLEEAPRHGYDLIREIETRTGGAYSPSPGIVYPTLTLLEEISQVEAQAQEGAKRLYAITPAGREHLAANRAEADVALARLDQLRRRNEAVDTGPVVRAMTNLKTALQQRLVEGTDKQVIFAVADIIDEAARKIERL